MTTVNKTQLTPPKLDDLMLRFVNRPVEAAAIEAEAGALGEVQPYEVAVGFRTDSKLAWDEGFAAWHALGLNERKMSAPPEWSAVVVRHEAIAAQPLALAGYPQRVRDLTTLIQAKDLTTLRPRGESQASSVSLRNWARKQIEKNDFAAILLAAAVLRSANDLDHADEILREGRDRVPEAMRPAFINEEAAMLWQRGDSEKALALWESLPETPASLFNRGMASLFLGLTDKALALLGKAIAQLPENDGWHHLGNLYLALAQMRT